MKQQIKIYNRQLKYPPVGVEPRAKTAHKVKKGSAIMIATHGITVYDEEKIFALLYLLQTGKAEMQIMTVDQNFFVAKIITNMYNIAKTINNYNYKNIIESLTKIEGMKLIYDIKDGKGKDKGKAITTPVYRIEIYQSQKLIVYMDLQYYQACMEKPFFLNVEYFSLKGYTKNIYKFLATNQKQKSVNIDTVAERCFFAKYPRYEQRRIIKEALQKIKNTKLGQQFDYKLEKDLITITPKTTKKRKNKKNNNSSITQESCINFVSN